MTRAQFGILKGLFTNSYVTLRTVEYPSDIYGAMKIVYKHSMDKENIVIHVNQEGKIHSDIPLDKVR